MPGTEAMFSSELRNERTSHNGSVARAGLPRPIVGLCGYRVVLDEMHVILLAVAPAWVSGARQANDVPGLWMRRAGRRLHRC